MRHQGVGKYLKEIAFMPDIPKPVYIILTPIEILTYFVTRPLTLSLRLFANMFAGHLLLLVFTIGGEHLLHGDLILKIFSPFSFAFAIGLSFFELGIQCLQAYIFTLLAALYTRYFIVVSKLIFRNGELDSSMPWRLNAR